MMIIEFKDGHEIEFRKFGDIWLADSVIFEGYELHSFLEKMRLVKAKINQWFEENAPEEIREKYNVRLPLWGEIKALPFKDQIAYGEGRSDRISDYMLGDGDDDETTLSYAGYSYDCGFLSCDIDYVYADTRPVRLCLEEKGMKKYIMKCGHASNAKMADGRPCCKKCGCVEIDREAKGTEGLEGRKAKCPECGKIESSHWGLPFFEYRPNEEFDQYYCGCRGWE